MFKFSFLKHIKKLHINKWFHISLKVFTEENLENRKESKRISQRPALQTIGITKHTKVNKILKLHRLFTENPLKPNDLSLVFYKCWDDLIPY